MNELERAMYEAQFRARHPDWTPEVAGADGGQTAGKTLGEQTGRPDLMGLAAMDTLPALLKGSVAASLGLPGDLESLVRLLSGGEQILPTTEDMQAKLPPVVPADAKGDKADFRRESVKAGELIGEFLPVAPFAAAAKVVKAVKKSRSAKAAAGGTAGGSVAGSEKQ